MTLQLELWHLITAIGTLTVTVIGAFAAIAKILMRVYTVRIDEKFDSVTDQIKHLADQGAGFGEQALLLERELASLRVEMMRDFTRREDHNQAIASIRVGLDNMSLRIEKALRGGRRFDE